VPFRLLNSHGCQTICYITFHSQIINLYITDKENVMNYFHDWAFENRKSGFKTGLNFILDFFPNSFDLPHYSFSKTGSVSIFMR